MDMSSIGSMIGGSGGGGSNWGAGLAIGGKAEQDIASFILPFFTSKQLRIGNNLAKKAINEGYDAAGNYIGESYDTARGDITGAQGNALGAVQGGYAGAEKAMQPYASSGAVGAQTMADMVKGGGFQFNPQDVYSDPSFQFELEQGTNALQGSAAARGGLLSGGLLKKLQKYGIDLASTKYQDAFNRALSSYTTNFQGAQNLASMGQSAAGTIGGYRAGSGTAQGNIYSEGGRNLAEIAGAYGTNMGNLSTARANNLADLEIQRGNINAGEWQGYGNAAVQQGQHLQEIGAMQMGQQSGGGTVTTGGGNGVSGLNFKNFSLKK